MKVNQVAEIINTISAEMLGEAAITTEDLSNIVDIGKSFEDVFADDNGVEQFMKKLVDHIGRVIVANREYRPSGVGLMRDAWDYGGILEKINIEMPEATENETWALTAGTKYDDILVYTPPSASAVFFDSMSTFDIPMSYAADRVRKTAFSSPAQFGAFFAGLENMVTTAISFYTEMLERRTLNNLIVGKGSVVNLLSLYNGESETPLAAADAISDPDFLRFASMQIALYSSYMEELSTTFNNGGWAKHTPKAYQRFVTLAAFSKGIEVYLQSNTYHDEFVKLVEHRDVAAWQGIGDGGTRTFEDISTINAYPAGADVEQDDPVEITGVVGVLFDRDAAAVCNENYRVTSFYNAGNETTKYYYKWDARYLNDFNENVIVFVVADPAEADGNGGNEGGGSGT